MEIYHTLAFSEIGTHRMRLNKPMTIEEAVSLGREYCFTNDLCYVGTYTTDKIHLVESELREKLYK